jgi:hypothetical protein
MVLHILTEGTQCLPREYKLEAGRGNIGKRQKQASDHEKVNDDGLKRDGAAFIRHESSFMACERSHDGCVLATFGLR